MRLHGDRRNSAKALARAGRLAELRRLAEAGDGHAARHLADRLARTGRLDELRERMAGGDRFARWAYADHLVRRRRFPEAIDTLRPLADLDIPGAQRRLARLLAGRGRFGEAVVALRRAPPHWSDLGRVDSWLGACGLAERAAAGGDGRGEVRAGYLAALRRSARAGDADARRELAWFVLLWWPSRLTDAIALLDDVGPDEWLHERLVVASTSRHPVAYRWVAIDLLGTAAGGAYRRTRAALLLAQGRRDDALAQLRSLAADGDPGAARDLAAILDAPRPQREIWLCGRPESVTVNGLAFGPDGETLAVWGHSPQGPPRVVLWDVATAQPRHTQRLESPYPGGVAFRPDGTVEELPGQPPWWYPHELTAPDGTLVALRTRGRIQLLRAGTGALVRERFVRGTTGLAFRPDGGLLAVGTGNAVHLWELATDRFVRSIATSTDAVAFHPDGTVLATADTYNGVVALWHLTR